MERPMNPDGRPHPAVVEAKLHVFDVDHTLTHKSTGMVFARAGLQTGMITWWQLITLPYYYVRYRLGRLSLGTLTREMKILQGFSRTELTQLAHQAWENEGRENLYRSAVAYLDACRATGAPLVLATSTFDVILEPLREMLGIEHVISSIVEFDQSDRSTGWLVNGPCYAEAKAERIAALLARLGVDPGDCAFYSDSFHDLPGLRLVGKPVAVNPDILLRRIAHRESWPIMRWT